MTQKNSKFSIIIPTYNCSKYIKQAVDSVLLQTFKDYEIIIVDDGSTDNTREILHSYIKDNKINYIYQENQGPAAARNTAIMNSKGDYIALLDADDLWRSDKLEIQYKYLKENPDLALICSNAYIFYNDDLINAEILHKKQSIERLTSKELFFMLMTKENPIISQTTVIARWVFDKIGLYDEKLSRMGSEDRDLSLRIISKYKAKYVKDCLAYYRIRKNSMHSNISKIHQARLYALEKLLKEDPSIGKNTILKNRAFANIYFSNACGYYERDNFKKALQELFISFKYYPFDFRIAKIFIKCFINMGFNKIFKTDNIKYKEN